MIGGTSENLESNCYLCSPREANNKYRREIACLKSSTLYLFADQRFRGYCLLIFDLRHETALDKLPESEYMESVVKLNFSQSSNLQEINQGTTHRPQAGNANRSSANRSQSV